MWPCVCLCPLLCRRAGICAETTHDRKNQTPFLQPAIRLFRGPREGHLLPGFHMVPCIRETILILWAAKIWAPRQATWSRSSRPNSPTAGCGLRGVNSPEPATCNPAHSIFGHHHQIDWPTTIQKKWRDVGRVGHGPMRPTACTNVDPTSINGPPFPGKILVFPSIFSLSKS